MRGRPTTLPLCLAIGLALAPFAAKAADPIAVMADACSGCHGTDGHSVGAMPAFSNKKLDELKSMLKEYKAGRREPTVMDRIAKGYSDEQLDAIAVYFASRKK
jgi:cytochrome subunit of sulfide dehydrogenase